MNLTTEQQKMKLELQAVHTFDPNLLQTLVNVAIPEQRLTGLIYVDVMEKKDGTVTSCGCFFGWVSGIVEKVNEKLQQGSNTEQKRELLASLNSDAVIAFKQTFTKSFQIPTDTCGHSAVERYLFRQGDSDHFHELEQLIADILVAQ